MTVKIYSLPSDAMSPPVDSGFVTDFVLASDYSELQRKLEALAAENTQMLNLLSDISGNHIEYYSEGECGMFAGIPLDYVSEINAHVARDVNAENTFKATDAALAEIRVHAKADGVELALKSLEESRFGDAGDLALLGKLLVKLRKESGHEQ